MSEEGFSVEAAFNIAIGIGAKLDALNASQRELLKYLRKAEPRSVRFPTSGVVDAAGGPLVMDFGTPSLGTFWEVRQVVVGGTEVNVATAGECGLYVSPQATLNSATLVNCVDIASFTTLPNVGYYPAGTIYVRPNEHIFLIAFGATAAQQLAANCFVRVFEDVTPEQYLA